MFKKIDLKSKKTIVIGSAIMVFIICIVLAVGVSANKSAEKESITYEYNEIEQALAEEVKEYLAQYMSLSERTGSAIADAAVQNYNIVIKSGTDVINDEITDAVRKRIRNTIFAYADNPERLTDNTLDALASGVTEIIWNAVLEYLSQSGLSLSTEYKEEYEYLTQSLQTQIDALKERKTKISINANIIDNTDTGITSEDIIAGIEDMREEDLRELAKRMGITLDELKKLIDTSVTASNKNISDNFDDKLEDEIEKLRRELQREISSSAGKTGTTGETGKTGEKGEKGEAGKDGQTTYIAYADDMRGTNFSLTPTETSKYIGTCITAETKQPTNYAAYSNWKEYRAYIITSTTDPDTGVTTVHIN